jgi:hypothetical protein
VKSLILSLVASVLLVSPAMANGLTDLQLELQEAGKDAAKHKAAISKIVEGMTDDEVQQVQNLDIDGFPLSDAVIEIFDALNYVAQGAKLADTAFPQ